MYDTVLVPTDGSESTVEVLDHAVDLARRHDATIHAMYVVDERKYHALPEDRRSEAQETLELKGERAVEEIAMRCEEADVDVQTMIREGLPSEVIVQHAGGTDVDVVVIGTHGSADHERHVKLGSVTQRVIENATVPVFVVQIGHDTEP